MISAEIDDPKHQGQQQRGRHRNLTLAPPGSPLIETGATLLPTQAAAQFHTYSPQTMRLAEDPHS